MSMTLCLCTTCDGTSETARSRRLVEAALDEAGLTDAVQIGEASCLGACIAPTSVAFQARQRATYLFSGLSLPDDIADLMATCRIYLSAPHGWIEDARPCGRLRQCLRARIPASPAH